MGLSASQGRMLLLTARRSDLEFRAQQISQKRLILSQQLEQISQEYEDATSNRQMTISLYEADADGKKVAKSGINLTYANLMSGTYATLSSTHSGIQIPTNGSYSEGAAVSNKPYRLVDADGAIVVSHISEIQTSIAHEYTDNIDSSRYTYKDKNGNDQDGPVGLYTRKTITKDDSTGVESPKVNGYVYDVDTVLTQGTDNPLKKFLDDENATIKIDPKHKIAEVTTKDADGKSVTRWFNLQDGSEYTEEKEKEDGTKETVPKKPDAWDKDEALENVELYSSSENITDENPTGAPQDKIVGTTYETLSTGNGVTDTSNLKKGKDGKYTLYDNDGTVIARYVVDPGLAYGATDVAGATTSPNYLQDCLRNGKYLLQQGNGLDDNENYKWSSVSWDATSNISDGYYTEDDDAAKAKYDRMQTQIQNQDKKLELELDQIETQRQAVTTEIDSIQKVIDENIEGTFNTFNA